MDQLLQNVINGAAASAVYLLIAVGITFVFGLTRLINFAHGQFLVVAVFVANDLIGWHINFFVAAAAAVATGAVLGYLSERLLFRFTLQNPYNGLIIGLGLLLALQSLAQEIWGGFPIDLPAPVTGGATVGGAFLSWDRVLVLAITAVVVGGFYLLLRSSRIGQQLRATHENATAAAHVGINIGRIVTIAFVLGSALAGLGGAMLGTLQPTSVTDGGNIIIIGFAVAVLGGLGSLSGALKASLLYGFGTTIIAGYLQPDLVSVFTYGIIIVVLLVKPSGLFQSSHTEPSFSRNSFHGLKRTRNLNRVERLATVLFGLVVGPVVFECFDGNSYVQALLLLAALYALQVYALSFIYETTGILSIAQAGLMAIGAYSGGVIAYHDNLGFWWAILVAAVCTTVAGAIIGAVVARCTGHYLLLVTLAFSALIAELLSLLVGLTNGDNGIILTEQIPRILGLSFNTTRAQFYLVLVVIVLAVTALSYLKRTKFGHQLAAVRENEGLAKSLGLRVGAAKIGIFAISGLVSSVGGVLFLYTQTVVTPDSFQTLLSIEIVIMLILGGSSLLGPAVGAVVFVLLPHALGLDPVEQELLFGVLLMVIVLVIPDGLVPTARTLYLRGWKPGNAGSKHREPILPEETVDEDLARQIDPAR